MKTQEYLREIRQSGGLCRAILTGIEVEKKSQRITFFLTTDTAYTPQELNFAREITAKYLPEGMTAEVKITKLVADVATVKNKILQILSFSSPAAAAFMRPEDVEVLMDGTGARFCLDVSKEEKRLLRTGEILDAITVGLHKSFCGNYVGAIRETDKETPVLDEEEKTEEAEESEEVLLPRTFPVVDYASLDGGEKPTRATYMADCNQESDNVTVCGEIVLVQEKQTGKGKPFFVFTLSDGTARMRVTYFSRQATLEKIRALTVGDKIVCSGANERYNGSLSYNAKRINKGAMPADFTIEEREMKKAPLFYHTVRPEPCQDFTQTNLFVKDVLPPALTENEFVVFDLETTGLNNTPVGGVMDSIIEIGAVKIKNGEIFEKFSSFVACEKKLSAEIIKLTGITDQMLVGAPDIKKVIPDFYKFCDGCLLVGHNVTFDYRFVEFYANKERYSFTQRRFDTLTLGQELLQLPNYKLNTLADYYGISFNHHRAYDDALTTAKIFIELIKQRKSLPNY